VEVSRHDTPRNWPEQAAQAVGPVRTVARWQNFRPYNS
jgi:hypothetical protein